MKYRVNDQCIGCGLYAGIYPEVFSMTDEGVAKAIETDVPPESEAAATEAKNSCPVVQ